MVHTESNADIPSTLSGDAIATRTRKAMMWSLLVHVILLTLLTLYRHLTPGPMGITEITWLEPEPVQAAVPETPNPPIQESVQTPHRTPAPEPEKEHFRRELVRAVVEPRPQDIDAFEDRLKDRLEALQRDATKKTDRISELADPGKSLKPRAAEPTLNPGSATRDLARSDVPTSAPIQLHRTETTKAAPNLAVSDAPKPTFDTAPAKVTESTASRNLAGAQLMGPVADRPLLSMTKPIYPEWAKREAIEASVTLRFFVLPDGSVKENILIERTSGFQDFDRNAITALGSWKFEKLGKDERGEQWGTITFHYRLTD